MLKLQPKWFESGGTRAELLRDSHSRASARRREGEKKEERKGKGR
jgi:hypothetical protein